MNLSDAIHRRSDLEKELQQFDEWKYKGESDGSIPRIKRLRTTLEVLGEQMNREIRELDEKIEEAIEGMTIDTDKPRPSYISEDKEEIPFRYRVWKDGYPFRINRVYRGYVFDEKWVCINDALYLANAFTWRDKPEAKESEA